MQKSILRSAAVLTSAVLAGAVVTGISPAMAAESSDCVANELKLPTGTPTDVHSNVYASDPTARYLVGNIQPFSGGDSTALLWTAGEPKVLQPTAGRVSSAIDVNSKGTVLGSTEGVDGQTQGWLYSKGTYRNLKAPAGMEWITVRALNERGDVVGYGVDSVTDVSAPIVWPAGGNPRRLPSDGWTTTADINDAGVVIGTVNDDTSTGLVWKRWDAKAQRITGQAGASVSLTKIRGSYITGVQVLSDGNLNGGLWNTRSTKFTSYPTFLDGVNSSGDVAYFSEGKTIVARQDGTQYEISAEGYNTVEYLYERGKRYDAAGDRDYGYGRAVLWSGCAS